MRAIGIATFIVLSCMTVDARAADLTARLGIAVQTGHGVCLSIPAQALPTHTLLSLVDPGSEPSVAQAEVTGGGKGCPGVKSKGMVGYRLRIVKGHVDDNAVLIAAVGDVAIVVSGNSVIAHIDKDARPEAFRSCTSADGVHLTVWDGAALKGTRLWHAYYYLGQDLEPSCTEQESAD